MLFSSSEFLFGFLPATVLAVMLSGLLVGRGAALFVLLVASFIFYAWWAPPYLVLLLVSITVNYCIGVLLMGRPSKALLALAVVFNIGLIAYFKYAQFLLDIAGEASGVAWSAGGIVLPLAISFFTFQQIAFQVDAYQGKVSDRNFLNYCLFVAFFPQLIAGPIVHHREVVPQYLRDTVFRPSFSNLWVGLIIFVIGLYKKVVIADGISVYADLVFGAAVVEPTLFDAWAGTLAYSFQIYFDFSGYSDMAIGMARVFGIKLPLNFHSPYKATNIIEFWQHWHMTLSRFLRDYLYIPLGGNRRGIGRRYVNLMATMLLGGLWHGAAWTFIFWGGLHGAYLVINHGWRSLRRGLGFDPGHSTAWGRGVSRGVTFLAVVVAWVFFRSENFDDALSVLGGMAGLNGIVFPTALNDMLGSPGIAEIHGKTLMVEPIAYAWLGAILLVVWLAPNTQELMANYDPVLEDAEHPLPRSVIESRDGGLPWRRRLVWLVPFSATSGVVAAMIVAYRGAETADFIYFVF